MLNFVEGQVTISEPNLRVRREGGITITVGTPDDETPIVDMVSMERVLLIIKEGGIYQFQFADQIDPGRANINLPQVLQKILGYGAKDEFVGRILLTAKKLFRPPHIPETFDHKRALSLSLTMVTEIAGLKDIHENVRKCISLKITEVSSQKNVTAIMLPNVDNLEGFVKNFISRADHCRQHLLDLARIFYGDKNNFEQVKAAVMDRHGTECPLGPFYDGLDKLAKFIRNTRNCVEHPQIHQYVEVKDFSLGANGKIVAPTIEIVHGETLEPATSILDFMAVIERSMIDATESLMVHLSEWNCATIGGLRFGVVEIPKNKRGKSLVRYTYGGMLGNQLALF